MNALCLDCINSMRALNTVSEVEEHNYLQDHNYFDTTYVRPHTVAIVRDSDCLHLATGNMKTNTVPTKTIVKVTFSIESLLKIMKQ